MLGHYFDKMNKPFEDRYSTSLVRIKQIIEATKGEEEVDSYFQQAGLSLMRLADIWEMISSGHVKTFTFDALKELNRSLYKEVSEHYETSFANPEKCTQVFGEDLGQKLCYIYTRMIDGISYVFEGQKFRLALNNELFIKSYEAITQGNGAVISELIHKESMDALDLKTEVAILRKFDAGFNSYSDVLLSSDLNDLRYLFSYGLYVGENEIKTAQYLMTLPEENIQRLANVCTEAFQKGYLNGNKEIPLSEKKTINIAYPISFERIIRKVVENFRDMGLEPLVYSDVFTAARPRLISTPPNPQFSYDHRFDEALFFSQDYVDASEAAFAALMEKHKDLAREMAGVALQESFGNKPFSPLSKGSCIAYNEEQTSLKNEQTATRNKTSNAYLPGSAWSFVIIAYPLPSIGEDYEDIFKDVIAVNSLDSQVYEKIQKQIIDVLDLGEFVHVVGKGENTTDILVKLHELTDSENQTNFENCTADLNVPVGEVYTSPVLLGTTGKIHVSQVYLNNLKYENLQISFKDGFIEGYTCTNFDTDEENKKFVHENLMHPHKTLPLGEFAIGTNTTAYVMAKKYKIAHLLPILIAEKMGPHFAIGDTCFAWSEDVFVCNSDGKEIIARDNEKSSLRKTDLSQAYTYKHTDITIPYDELALIEVLTKTGKKIPVIKEGRFVLPGTELLNEPFNHEGV